MKNLSIIILMLLTSLTYAQNLSLEGTIIDEETKETIAFATIALYNNSELVDGVSANEDGNFQLETSKTFTHLEVSFIGYKRVNLLLSNIENIKEIIISLTVDTNALDEVIIEGKKTTIHLKIDRKIINLGGDIQQSGVNALEAFDQISEVQTDISNGTISLRGSENVSVLVNGKPSPLSATELLQQISASSINRIEIITSPSAKHKADGLSGIINIILKKNQNLGLNLGLNSSIGTKRYSFGINGNYNFTSLNFRLNASKSSLKTIDNQTISREFGSENTERIFTPYRFDGDVYKIDSGFDFFINDKNEFSIGIDYTDDSHSYFNKSSYTNVTGRSDYEYLRENEHSHNIVIFNANYRLKFNEDNHFLELDYQINSSKNDYPITDSEDNILLFNQFLTEDFVLQSFALDYAIPIKDKIIVETGIFRNTQELKSQSLFNELDSPMINNQFAYNETLIGLYGLAKLSFNKLDIQTGLRFEHFKSKSVSLTNNFASHQKYSNLFPSAHLSYTINDTSTLNLGYSKRVSRPNFHHVNAFQIVSPLFIWEYNPNITPEISDNIELGFQKHFKGFNLGLTTFYRHRKNVILWTESSQDDMQIFRYENSGAFNSYGFESNIRYNITPSWNSILTANYYLTNIENSSAVTWNKIYSSSIQFKNTFNIAKNITTDITYLYRPEQQNAFNYNESRSRLDFAVRAKFLKNTLSTSLRVVDIFNSYGLERRTKTPNLVQDTNWEFQSARGFNFLFSVNYKLFENKMRTRNRRDRKYNETPID
jgi:outer membrane receptor protein involved in Fe transport